MLVRLWHCFRFKLPVVASRPPFSFCFSLIWFVSWSTSVLRAIPYYAALHCHNPYITCQSDESKFMVQGAHRLPREFQRISRRKSISGTHLRSCVALCRPCVQTVSFSFIIFQCYVRIEFCFEFAKWTIRLFFNKGNIYAIERYM